MASTPDPGFRDFSQPIDRRAALRYMGGAALLAAGGGLLSACGSSSTSSQSSPTGGGVQVATKGLIFTPATKRGGTLTLAVNSSQSGPADPLRNFGNVSFYLSSLCFDRLAVIDRTKPGFQLAPRLAESWSISDDASVYTIKIRPGVKFHDGSTLTAKDIAFNLRRFVSSTSLMASNLNPYYKASGVSIVDSMTVRVKLIKANARLMYVFREWNCSIYPDGTTDFEKCVGTGPFRFVSYNGSTGASTVRNPHYWKPGKPYLDAFRITVIPEADSAVQALELGQISAIAANSLSQASVLEVSKKKKVDVLRLPEYWFDDVQINPYDKPFTDARLREAAAISIDPKVVADQLYQGDAAASANIPVSRTDPFFPESLKSFKANIPKAKKLVAEAGYPHGVDLSILVSDDPISNPVMQVFADQVTQSGIRVHLNTKPAATWTNPGNGWGTGKAWEDGWWLKDPLTMCLYIFSDTSGYREWTPKWVATAIEKAFVTNSQAEQIDLVKPVFEAASTQAGVLIPVIRDGYVPVSSKLRGLNANTFNLDGYFEQVGLA
jgi:peptide/nickel transport system substrate-binding protein